MTSNINSNDLIALRNYRSELQRCFHKLDKLAANSYGEQKEKYEADAAYLREISIAGELNNIKKAINNFKASIVYDKPVITSAHAYDLELQKRLTDAHRKNNRR